MQPYLAPFIENFGMMATLCWYIIACIGVTFLLTAIFCSAPTSQHKTPVRTLNNIDFLKILLTYVIVLHHQYQTLNWDSEGFYAVEFFFIISGFMLTYTFSAQKDTVIFIKNKLACFIPYIFLGSILVISTEYRFNFTQFLSGIFLFNCSGFYMGHSYYGPSWYLTVLFWVSLGYFYLLKNYKKATCNLIIGFITFLSLSTLHNQRASVQLLDSLNSAIPFISYAFTRGLAMMGMGYFLALTYAPKQASQNNFFKLFTGLLEITLIFYFGIAFFIQKYSLSRCLIIIGATFLLWSFINQKGYLSIALEKINWRPFSKYMLAIYMVHWFICQLQDKFGLWSDYQPLTRIVLCFICTTILGIIAFHTIHWGYWCNSRLRNK